MFDWLFKKSEDTVEDTVESLTQKTIGFLKEFKELEVKNSAMSDKLVQEKLEAQEDYEASIKLITDDFTVIAESIDSDLSVLDENLRVVSKILSVFD